MQQLNWDDAAKKTAHIFSSDTPVDLVKWSDKLFKEKWYARASCQTRVKMEGLEHCKQFLNFYVSGVSTGNVINSLMSCIWYMGIPDSKDFLINEDLEAPNPKITISEGCTSHGRLTTFTYANHYQGVRESTSGGPSNSGMSGEKGLASLSTADAKKWYAAIYDALDDTDKDNPEVMTSTRSKAMDYLGYLALQMCRLIIKDPDQVATHIFHYNTDRFTHFWDDSVYNEFTPPPHSLAANFYKNSLERFKPASAAIMTWLIGTHCFSDHMASGNIKGILKSSTLQSFAKVGLGCLMWVTRASTELKVPTITILKYVATRKHQAINKAIIDTLINYVDPEKGELTWPWARLLEDGAFYNLGTKQNPEFAAIMMSIVNTPTNDLWETAQFKNIPTEARKTATQWGNAIRHEINKQDYMTHETEEAKAIAEMFVSQKGRQDTSHDLVLI